MSGPAAPSSADGYRMRVVEAYRGEVYGEGLFESLRLGLAARGEALHADKLAVLERLETWVKVRVRPLVEVLCADACEEPSERERGRLAAAPLLELAWPRMLAALATDLRRYVERYDELVTLGPAVDRPILELVARHERALLEFVERELAGDETRSLDSVLALLDNA